MYKIVCAWALAVAPLTFGNLAHAEGNAANRSDKTAYVAAEVIGLTLLPVSGLRAGYFISPDLTAEFGYASGGASVGDFEADKTLIELKVKYFIGDSFYIDGGLAQESWKVTYPVANANDPFTTSKLDADVTNMGAVIHIGNQWQWSGFTLGCDWVGYFASLSTDASFSDSANADPTDKKQEEDDVESVMGSGSAHVTRFYLGWSF